MDELVAPGLNSRLTFGGLATGLDTGAIVQALIQADRRPITLLQSRRGTLSAQQSAMQDLNTKLLSLRDAARALDNLSTGLTGSAVEEEFLAYTATPSDETLLEVETTGGAAPGSFEVDIGQLATTARQVSFGVADPEAGLAPDARFFAVTVGGSPIAGVALAAGDSLYDLRDGINGASQNQGEVRADVIFDGTNHRLVVSGTEFGAASELQVFTDLEAPGGGPFIDPDTVEQAVDAQLSYLGVDVTSPTNDVTDLVPGITLRLRGADPGNPVTVDVTRDDEAIEEKLQEFVDAYNAVRQIALAQTQINPETNRGGVLIGDSLLRSIEATMRDALSQVYTFEGPIGPNGPPTMSFASIGVTFNSDATLALDAEALRGALDKDAGMVRELLSGRNIGQAGAVDGIATALARALEPILDPSDEGLESFLKARDRGYEERIDSIDEQIARLEDRLAAREEFLVRRFSQLESLISTLQSQSGFLGG